MRTLRNLISKGYFCEVYSGKIVFEGKNYVLKKEGKKDENSFLEQECYNLLNLKGPVYQQ